MSKFRKKPVVIEAVQVREALRAARHEWSALPGWMVAAYERGEILFLNHPISVSIKTLEGEMRGDIDDWIICGVRGELYPCKPDIFAETYEPA